MAARIWQFPSPEPMAECFRRICTTHLFCYPAIVQMKQTPLPIPPPDDRAEHARVFGLDSSGRKGHFLAAISIFLQDCTVLVFMDGRNRLQLAVQF